MTQIIESVPERLVGFINAEISVSPDPIEIETDLLLTGAVDSLGVVRITQWLEDELGFDVDPVEVTLENFQTVSKMVSYAQSKLD
ncbi:MAG: acyl carrier protein [Acidimicrobiales bacterium]